MFCASLLLWSSSVAVDMLFHLQIAKNHNFNFGILERGWRQSRFYPIVWKYRFTQYSATIRKTTNMGVANEEGTACRFGSSGTGSTTVFVVFRWLLFIFLSLFFWSCNECHTASEYNCTSLVSLNCFWYIGIPQHKINTRLAPNNQIKMKTNYKSYIDDKHKWWCLLKFSYTIFEL